MSPPTEAEQDAALASLAGSIGERKPTTDHDRDMLRLRLAADAKAAGISWAQIGRTLGMSGPEAKRHIHRLARRANGELLAGAGNVVPDR